MIINLEKFLLSELSNDERIELNVMIARCRVTLERYERHEYHYKLNKDLKAASLGSVLSEMG